ncbi:cytosine deaminase [Gluconacetobacter asukensis]|uniref:Cytosine deaminase n=1 Tax=Gluconacetobacter asukensis TaxID=1017181 RepID=A0A7W4NYH5_9PROT|nr:cytosine deaminase [Gluconacetobacter asukensis]MBB2170594.1 cytosine deaminase [Gluconacetobacter asukensis]
MGETPSLIRDVRIPDDLLAAAPDGAQPTNGLTRCDLLVEQGRIGAIFGHGTAPEGLPVAHDHGGRIVLPLFADIHTHLDKSFIWDRTANPDGTFAGAIAAVTHDREGFWTPDDVRRRMMFALECAWAHGTGLLRTHLDTIGSHGEAVWPLFREIAAQWQGRIALQAVALVMVERYLEPGADALARTVADTPGGMLGAVIMQDNATDERLDALIGLAADHGCDLDLHVDENGIAPGTALERVADRVMAARFSGRVLCGHCCSLARQDDADQKRIVAKVRDAGMGIVSLPTCNLYLQDRGAGKTPLWRGVTLVQELAAAGVPVMFASDNVRDPFFPYGDYDMLDVFAQSVRIAQLDAPPGDWLTAVTTRPAAWMGHDLTIRANGPADLVLTDARTLNELLSRPKSPRRVLRNGVMTMPTPPPYEKMDELPGMHPVSVIS